MRVKKKRTKKLGRPPTGKKIRKEHVAIYLTEQDARRLSKVAVDLGFYSRSRMIAGILEALIVGGFAPLAFLQAGFKFQKLAEGKDLEGAGYYLANRPMPSLGDEPIEDVEMRRFINYLKKESQKGGGNAAA